MKKVYFNGFFFDIDAKDKRIAARMTKIII